MAWATSIQFRSSQLFSVRFIPKGFPTRVLFTFPVSLFHLHAQSIITYSIQTVFEERCNSPLYSSRNFPYSPINEKRIWQQILFHVRFKTHQVLPCTSYWWFNRLTPNDPYMGRTAPLTSKRCILYIYSTNIDTEYFKHVLYSVFFS